MEDVLFAWRVAADDGLAGSNFTNILALQPFPHKAGFPTATLSSFLISHLLPWLSINGEALLPAVRETLISTSLERNAI